MAHEEVTITEVIDVGQVDRVIRYRSWELEGESGHASVRNQTRHETLPEDLMAGLADEIGDGLAKVTVGAELAHSKEYGCKAQSFVSISVHCNNDDETIEKVHGVLHSTARELANQDLKEMIEDRDHYVQKDKAQSQSPGPRPDGRLARQSPGKLAPKAGKAAPKTAPKPGVKPKGKVRARPNYKR